MLGGYLEFFMQPAIAEKYLSLRREFDELIQNKVSRELRQTKFPLAGKISILHILFLPFPLFPITFPRGKNL